MTKHASRNMAEFVCKRIETRQEYSPIIQEFADREIVRVAESYLALLDEHEQYKIAINHMKEYLNIYEEMDVEVFDNIVNRDILDKRNAL